MRRLIPILIILIAAIAAAAFWYITASNKWQENYRQSVSEGMVSLLQNNPYDRNAVVVIVIDGLRWEEGIGAEDEYLRHLWNDLRPMGTLLTNFYIASPTATTSSHSAMMSGRISTVPNDGHIRPVFPNFMEYYRDARQDYLQERIEKITAFDSGLFRPDADSRAAVDNLVSEALSFAPEKTSCYLGKDLIYEINQSGCGRYPDDDVFLMSSLRDIEVKDYFRAKIPDEKPNMVFVNLGDVDECGHEAEWHYYVDSIRQADRFVWDMWQTLQAESRYRDKTYFIVTTDHGRHIPERGGYPHHGCFCEGCRRSFMLIIGPGIRQDYVSDAPYSEIDLAPTIGRMMGFATPGANGEPIDEVFEDTSTLPGQRMTPTMEVVAKDKEDVGERDTIGILEDAIFNNSTQSLQWNNETIALAYLFWESQANRLPQWFEENESRLSGLPLEPVTFESLDDLIVAYPYARWLRTVYYQNTIPPGTEYPHERLLNEALEKGLIDINAEHPGESMTVMEASLIAPMFAMYGKENNQPDKIEFAYKLMLDLIAQYEGEERVYTPGLENLIADFRYREGPNEIFTEKDMSMADRMWLIWGIEHVLMESDENDVPSDLYMLLLRQHRLLIAFMHEWQDANSIVGGTGDYGEAVDFVAQGLALSNLAEFKPWRRWELDELGYSMHIYATPLFSWPPYHFFYLLGQANALAGEWSANELLRMYVNDDGSIRHDLLDLAPAMSPSAPDYPMNALALAYGLSRFEKADYGLFDLEAYPIVHQLGMDISW